LNRKHPRRGWPLADLSESERAALVAEIDKLLDSIRDWRRQHDKLLDSIIELQHAARQAAG
jgi:hypothetical protein